MAGLADFSVDDLESFSRVLRDAGTDAADMPDVAQRVVDFLHHNLCRADRSPACVAVSIQKTHPYHLLPSDIRASLEAGVTGAEPSAALVGLARAGTDVPGLPTGTTATALDGASVQADPFVGAMASAMGLATTLLVDPTAVIQSGVHREDLSAFLVPDLLATSWLAPPERARAEALGARSLLVLGGGLPTGDLFFTWLVGRDRPTEKSARFIRALTPAIKAALIPHALRPWGVQPASD
jgi:hypothetical protein